MDYNKKVVSALREEIQTRNIKIPQGYIHKQKLVELLEEDDERKTSCKSVDGLERIKCAIKHNKVLNKFTEKYIYALHTVGYSVKEIYILLSELTKNSVDKAVSILEKYNKPIKVYQEFSVGDVVTSALFLEYLVVGIQPTGLISLIQIPTGIVGEDVPYSYTKVQGKEKSKIKTKCNPQYHSETKFSIHDAVKTTYKNTNIPISGIVMYVDSCEKYHIYCEDTGHVDIKDIKDISHDTTKSELKKSNIEQAKENLKTITNTKNLLEEVQELLNRKVIKQVLPTLEPAKVELPKVSPNFSKKVVETYKKQNISLILSGNSFNIGAKKILKPRPLLEITIEELRQEIEDKEFIKIYLKQVKLLMKFKSDFYSKKIAELEKEFNAMKIKINELMKNGADRTDIKEAFPIFFTMNVSILNLKYIKTLVDQKLINVTTDDIYHGLRLAVNDPERGIPALTGRDEIMNKIAAQIYSFSKSYKAFASSFNNIMLMGGAGVGKTFTATILAFVYSNCNILATDSVRIITSTDIIGQYVGSTGPRTRSTLMEILEGVLFIDEAYSLTPKKIQGSNSSSFCQEAMTEKINHMDKYIGMGIIIVGGYEKPMMEDYLGFNEGLSRRFPYRFVLSKYSVEDLTTILLGFIKSKSDVVINEDVKNYIFTIVSHMDENDENIFLNQAGDMLNLGTALVKTINSSYKIKWGDVFEKNKIIIMNGFKEFLCMKNLNIDLDEISIEDEEEEVCETRGISLESEVSIESDEESDDATTEEDEE